MVATWWRVSIQRYGLTFSYTDSHVTPSSTHPPNHHTLVHTYYHSYVKIWYVVTNSQVRVAHRRHSFRSDCLSTTSRNKYFFTLTTKAVVCQSITHTHTRTYITYTWVSFCKGCLKNNEVCYTIGCLVGARHWLERQRLFFLYRPPSVATSSNSVIIGGAMDHGIYPYVFCLIMRVFDSVWSNGRPFTDWLTDWITLSRCVLPAHFWLVHSGRYEQGTMEKDQRGWKEEECGQKLGYCGHYHLQVT